MAGPRRTAAQWQAIIDQQAHSSLSIAEFCRKKNLSVSSFHRWRRLLRHKSQDPGFLELTAPLCDAEDSRASWFLEVDLPGGGHLRLKLEP